MMKQTNQVQRSVIVAKNKKKEKNKKDVKRSKVSSGWNWLKANLCLDWNVPEAAIKETSAKLSQAKVYKVMLFVVAHRYHWHVFFICRLALTSINEYWADTKTNDKQHVVGEAELVRSCIFQLTG